MVFSTTNLFKGVACPKGEKCALTSCIYSHDATPPSEATRTATLHAKDEQNQEKTSLDSSGRATKRRKITYDDPADKPPSKADFLRNTLAASRADSGDVSTRVSKSQQPQSLARPVSPPPTNGSTPAQSGTRPASVANSTRQEIKPPETYRKQDKIESLNPRLIANDPAGHQKRSLFLKHLHAEMTRLNQAVKESPSVASKHLLVISEQELISLALDDEEKIAKQSSALYGNKIKQRIAALKKMPVGEWITQVKSTFAKEPAKPVKKSEKPIETGLNLEQEYLILPQLVVDQKPLVAHGYIPEPPSEEQAAQAAAAVEASQNWEICDRCSSRFQVFPERNEEGLLTANGPCVFHPRRKIFPQKSKGDIATREPYYPCCNEVVGAPGCTKNAEHVFKASNPARLAAVMPFVNTPENASPAKDGRGQRVDAVTFDCEMGYTALGLELIRLTAVSWPSGDLLLDVLVRPLGGVIDFNSMFSGVFPEHFRQAIPYDDWNISTPPQPPEDLAAPRPLPIVDSPQRARELLCSFITPETPLLGHAIDNDLNVVRLCHPTIVDTIILYPHPRGLPMRFGLRMLAQKHLHRHIQQGGDRGHDSLEDAVATGDLVRLKVGEKWRMLRSGGWQIVDGQLIPPPPAGNTQTDAQQASLEKHCNGLLERTMTVASKSRKRRKKVGSESIGGSSDETTDGEDAATGAGL